MAGNGGPRKAGDIARQLQALAERRRQHLLELHRSGRWRRYYSEDQFMGHMRDSVRDIAWWGNDGADALAKAGLDAAAQPELKS
jgi:uncharacterized repeat protein (TIGR03809 family)